MFLGFKLTFGLKVLLCLLVFGLFLWLALEWRKYQRYKQMQRDFARTMNEHIVASRGAGRDMQFTMTPLSDAEYLARRKQLSDH